MTDTTEWTNPETGEKARVKMAQICTVHKALMVENENWCAVAERIDAGTCDFVEIGLLTKREVFVPDSFPTEDAARRGEF
ncbi:hypothetical protein LCGC14_1540820 [marine sediment metagenome]|uniref:Uncharacterized protein n=1 Tax=marine sediment metagenome TaxID=412755 RepID=A0A0F9LTV0_9ZZZZ